MKEDDQVRPDRLRGPAATEELPLPPGGWDDAIDAAISLAREGPGFAAWAGAMAKKKIDRQLSEARREGMERGWADVARHLECLKRGNAGSPQQRLQNLVTMSSRGQRPTLSGRDMLDALRFAGDRLLDIELTLPLGENSLPPRCAYRITLTPAGEAFLTPTPEPPTPPTAEAFPGGTPGISLDGHNG